MHYCANLMSYCAKIADVHCTPAVLPVDGASQVGAARMGAQVELNAEAKRQGRFWIPGAAGKERRRGKFFIMRERIRVRGKSELR